MTLDLVDYTGWFYKFNKVREIKNYHTRSRRLYRMVL
jgi:hypothetical protein